MLGGGSWFEEAFSFTNPSRKAHLEAGAGFAGRSWFEAFSFMHPLREVHLEAGAGLEHLPSVIL